MFERDVLIDGNVYSTHRVGAIWHSVGDASTIFVHSVNGDVFDGNWIETQYRHDLDWTLTPETAEAWLVEQPEFEPYVDPGDALLDEITSMLDDEQAATVPQAFKEWKPGVDYAVGDRRRYNGVLYKCLQAHTSQADQTPDIVTSLWARILNPDPDVPLPWEQPDSTNPYMTGDKVTHNGHLWISDIDYNVYEPGVAGWTCLDPDPEPEPEPTPELEPSDYGVWVQPDSANPYMTGDRVHYPTLEDPVYESDVDNNVWAPNVYGWHVVEAD